MANLSSQRRYAWASLAGGLVCLAGLTPAAAQTSASPQAPIVVDRRLATRLLISQVTPEYPPVARVNYIWGLVRVEMLVSREGRVTRAHVLQGHPLLAAASLRAIRRWLYRPLMTAAGPAEFLTTVNLNFSLRAKKGDQLPVQPEADLSRQVKPPAVLTQPVDPASTSSVHIRVLLNDEGQVIDTQPLKGPPSQFEEAKKAVEQWTFLPARWGSLRLPWYFEVDVPVADLTVHSAAADPGGR